MKALIGQKLGMTQIFGEDGNVQRVTVIEAGPCVVTQLKTDQTDGYNAVQIGFGEAKHQAKPQAGHLKAAKANSKVLKEVRLLAPHPAGAETGAEGDPAGAEVDLKVGTNLDVSAFEVGDKVQVTATSKGKGFAGTIKRHNFHRGPKTHGSHNYRAPGSIGAGYPQHVMKGMRMAGRMGGAQVTTRGLKVVLVDPKNNLLALSGAVPGPRRGVVMVQGAQV
ncbi:MAG TPA: 50S ribosomal protein L3 [Candidatus Saccharimonadales bacterium]|nr:50S ribosomal protein L3 [Candidatus Saccharimonadales bacterium]